jgi:hypothetical protein
MQLTRSFRMPWCKIQELQARLDDAGQPQRQQGGFLDSMRDALFGRAASVSPRLCISGPARGGRCRQLLVPSK